MPYFPKPDGRKTTAEPKEKLSRQMVCGRPITQDPPYPNTAVYHGSRIVFCTRYCLEAFEADPERFYCAHSKTDG